MTDVVIGRDPSCDIQVDDKYASPRHCKLSLHPQTQIWWVIDMGSTNGTRIRRAVSGLIEKVGLGMTARLSAGDVLIVGRTELPPFTPTGMTRAGL